MQLRFLQAKMKCDEAVPWRVLSGRRATTGMAASRLCFEMRQRTAVPTARTRLQFHSKVAQPAGPLRANPLLCAPASSRAPGNAEATPPKASVRNGKPFVHGMRDMVKEETAGKLRVCHRGDESQTQMV